MSEALDRLSEIVLGGNRVVIVGRGATGRLAEPRPASDPMIGFNLVEHPVLGVADVVFVSQRWELTSERGLADHANAVLESDLNRIPGATGQVLKVGSTTFGLGALLEAIDVLATARSRKLQVVLLGFDFRHFSSSDDVQPDNRGLVPLQTQVDIESQRLSFFDMTRRLARIDVTLASFDFLSTTSPRNWVAPDSREALAHNTDIEIVAEITTNHFGSMERLEALVEGAARAGADSVKLQIREVDTFYSVEQLSERLETPFGTTFGEYRRALELTDEQLRAAIAQCRQLGVGLFVSVLDIPSARRALSLGFTRLKIPSTVSARRSLHEWVARNFAGEIVASTGMMDASTEAWIRNRFSHATALFLLHCVSSYPAWPGDLNLANIARYGRLGGNVVPGYSSHDLGEIASMMAVGAGARMVEKHVKIGEKSWAHFDATAADVVTEFPRYVDSVRAASRAMGNAQKRVIDSEHHKY